MCMEIYYKKDIAEIINRPLRTITQWTDSGLIVPEIKASRGKGKARVYSKRNVIEFAMVNLMTTELEIHQRVTKQILGFLRDEEEYGYVAFWVDFKEVKDFYESSDWGNSKELAAIIRNSFWGTKRKEGGRKTFIENPVFFQVVPINENENEESKFKVSSFGGHSFEKYLQGVKLRSEVLWLGSIRNVAIEMCNIAL